MTNEQIVKKAMEKATNNGWIPRNWGFNDDGKLVNWSMEGGLIGLPENAVYGIIFSHDFAKAFWGVCWQYHLQKMVLKKEPAKYLKKYVGFK